MIFTRQVVAGRGVVPGSVGEIESRVAMLAKRKGGEYRVIGRDFWETSSLVRRLELAERRMKWKQVAPIDGGWRQWMTDEKSDEDIPAAEILEVGSWAGYDSDDAHYVLLTDGGTGLYSSLEDAMTAAEQPELVRPLTQRPSPSGSSVRPAMRVG